MVHSKDGFIMKHWRGEYSLARSYWLHLVLGSVFVALLAVPLLFALRRTPPRFFASVLLLVTFLVGCWQIWGMKGVWSSASRASASPFADLAKLMIIVHAIASVVVLCSEPDSVQDLWRVVSDSHSP